MVLTMSILHLVPMTVMMGANRMMKNKKQKRRLFDFLKGVVYGMGSGVVAFGCGYMLGKMVVLGFSTAMELQGWIAT